MRQFAMFFLLIGACKQVDANGIAEECGQQECPAGTAFNEARSVKGGWDAKLGANPATFSGEVAFGQYGEGECSYTCEALYQCAASTVPVMTDACFTCAPYNDVDGVLPGHACE